MEGRRQPRCHYGQKRDFVPAPALPTMAAECSGCRTEGLRLGDPTADTHLLAVLEAGRPRPRCRQGAFF